MARVNGGAVTGAPNWDRRRLGGAGTKMVNETSKSMLRGLQRRGRQPRSRPKPFKGEAATLRLTKVRETITRLGRTLSIEINQGYHRLRIQELELTADYLAKKEEERERQREEKARLREERAAQLEIERERSRLEKERAHYVNALSALGDDADAVARLQEQLAEIDKAIEDVDYRAANIRAGYVYVISNVGSFGPDVVKIGMTRRLEPRDRVRELGDASVPFRYDTHALFFSDDAVAIESALHRLFADRRINRVNHRREFFKTTPTEVKAELANLTGDLTEFTEFAEALEFRQSVNATGADSG